MRYILEACVDSLQSARNAAEGGADRLEVCGNLIIGGTSPGLHFFRQLRRELPIQLHVLVRPRFGDFLYSPAELQVMREEIRMFREEGADGVVFGVLCPDGRLDCESMEELKQSAGNMSITLHRAFDVCRDPWETLEHVRELGIQTILTSGQRDTCMEGLELIRALAVKARGTVDILCAGGVEAAVIRTFLERTSVTSFHMSGKVAKDSGMRFRAPGIHMGLKEFSEYEIWQTDLEKIASAKAVLADWNARIER